MAKLHPRRMTASEQRAIKKQSTAAPELAKLLTAPSPAVPVTRTGASSTRPAVSADTTRPRTTQVKRDPAPTTEEPWDEAERAPVKPRRAAGATTATATPTATAASPKSTEKAVEPASEDEGIVGIAGRLADFPDLIDVLPDLATEYRAIQDQLNKLEARKKELSTEIDPLMLAVGAKSITHEEWTVVRCGGGRSDVVPELLLMKGVGMDIIKACTKKQSWTYVQVRKPTKAEQAPVQTTYDRG